MKAKILSRSAIALAVAVALSAGYVVGRDHVEPVQAAEAAQAAMMPAEAAAKTGVPDFSGLVETYGPAVVNISAKRVVKQTSRRMQPQVPIDPGDPFFQFFQRFYGFPGIPRGPGVPRDDGA